MQYISRASFFALSVSLSTGSFAQAEAISIRQCVAQEADREGLSGSILVSQRDQTIANVARGRLADETSPPIDASTRFNLGSASKMFTAVAIGQLIEEGKLRFDQPVGDVVSGLTPEASRVTIRQLLNHTSGLGDFFRPQNMGAMLRARSASDILPLIASDKPAFPPGSKFSYSNSGFALLGIVIERVSGLTYGAYLRRHVFRTAGMDHTGLDPRPLSTLAVGMTAGWMPNASAGRQLVLIGSDGKSLRRAADRSSSPPKLRPAPGATEGYGSPAGGLFSTVEDMRKFGVALMQGKLMRPTTVHEFTSPQVEAAPAASDKPAKYYGFGFGISSEGGLRWYGHNGGTLGANAEFAIQPDHQWVISVLSNRDPPTATHIMAWIKALLADPSRRKSCSTRSK